MRIHTLPAPQGLVAASDRFSTLRGPVAENNLGFKCTRKRLVFETLHLDVDGGVGERRTPAAIPQASETVSEGVGAARKKGRKRVGFSSDRPELDF